MTSLKQAISRVSNAAARGYQLLPENLTHTERAAKKIAADTSLLIKQVEEDRIAFLNRAARSLEALKPREVPWLLRTVWEDETFSDLAIRALRFALAKQRQSYDVGIIAAYLAHFPVRHPAISQLLDAVKIVAERHAWNWREKGRLYSLWDPSMGPSSVGQYLLEGNESLSERLNALGFGPSSLEFEFVSSSVEAACRIAAQGQFGVAEGYGNKLLSFTPSDQENAVTPPMLIYALLKPWARQSPSDAYKVKLISFLSKRVGDPRLERVKWDYIEQRLTKDYQISDAREVTGIFRRWVIQTVVRQFFDIVAKTTDNKLQWDARTKFWLAYLDKGCIEDAWFAFGPQAETAAQRYVNAESVLQYGKVVMTGNTDPSHSALLLSIGDLRIVEWSHNGACRFWDKSDPKAPEQYQKRYTSTALKAMAGGAGFESLRHHGSWQNRFSNKIYKRTNIPHPQHGKGAVW